VQAADAVARKNLAAAEPRERKNVLEVGRGGGRGANRGGVEHAAPETNEKQRGETASDLESPRRYIAVRDPVAKEVEQRAEQQRAPS
jgi:hypothetical protein